MLILDEAIDADGAPLRTSIARDGAAFRLRVGEREAGSVSRAMIEAVMARYGKPLADDVTLSGPSLDLGDGRVLRVLRHRAFYDVIARDFAVLSAPGAPPLAELARGVAAALLHLAEAAASARR